MNGRILLFLAMLLSGAALSAPRPILVFNEDNSAYFFGNKYGGAMDERARGVAVTDRHD